MTDHYITDKDIERMVQYLAREGGGMAQARAQERADQLSRNGADEASAIWGRIAAAFGDAST